MLLTLRKLLRFTAYLLVFGLGLVVVASAAMRLLATRTGGGLSITPQRAVAAQLISLLAGILTLRAIASRVGYRPVDALWLVVPIVNLYIIIVLLWRVASLPDAYWNQGDGRVTQSQVKDS